MKKKGKISWQIIEPLESIIIKVPINRKWYQLFKPKWKEEVVVTKWKKPRQIRMGL